MALLNYRCIFVIANNHVTIKEASAQTVVHISFETTSKKITRTLLFQFLESKAWLKPWIVVSFNIFYFKPQMLLLVLLLNLNCNSINLKCTELLVKLIHKGK